jgi:hypothetical protein
MLDDGLNIAGGELERVAASAVDAARRVLRADAAALLLAEHEGDVRVLAQRGLDTAALADATAPLLRALHARGQLVRLDAGQATGGAIAEAAGTLGASAAMCEGAAGDTHLGALSLGLESPPDAP